MDYAIATINNSAHEPLRFHEEEGLETETLKQNAVLHEDFVLMRESSLEQVGNELVHTVHYAIPDEAEIEEFISRKALGSNWIVGEHEQIMERGMIIWRFPISYILDVPVVRFADTESMLEVMSKYAAAVTSVEEIDGCCVYFIEEHPR